MSDEKLQSITGAQVDAIGKEIGEDFYQNAVQESFLKHFIKNFIGMTLVACDSKEPVQFGHSLTLRNVKTGEPVTIEIDIDIRPIGKNQ